MCLSDAPELFTQIRRGVYQMPPPLFWQQDSQRSRQTAPCRVLAMSTGAAWLGNAACDAAAAISPSTGSSVIHLPGKLGSIRPSSGAYPELMHVSEGFRQHPRPYLNTE